MQDPSVGLPREYAGRQIHVITPTHAVFYQWTVTLTLNNTARIVGPDPATTNPDHVQILLQDTWQQLHAQLRVERRHKGLKTNTMRVGLETIAQLFAGRAIQLIDIHDATQQNDIWTILVRAHNNQPALYLQFNRDWTGRFDPVWPD